MNILESALSLRGKYMKKHHLDPVIHKIKKYLAGDEIDISLIQKLLISFEEIKRLDENHESLSDWMHVYDD